MATLNPASSPPHSAGELRTRLRSNPEDGQAWLELAMLLARREPGTELREAISRSLELLPDNYQAWLLAGLEARHRLGAQAAQRWLQDIIQQQPALVAPRLAAAQMLCAVQAQGGEQRFREIITAFPHDARANLLLAEHLQNQGKPGEAADFLEQALQLQPGLAENWAALAMLRLAQGRYDAVVAAAGRALELQPEEPGPRLSRAEAYRQAGQWQPALQDYRAVLRVMPNNPYILLGIGACLAGQHEFGAALRSLQEAVRIKPELPEARLNIALVLASQAQPRQALASLEPLLSESGLPAPLRQAAEIARAQLHEHTRLSEALQQASQSLDLCKLQDTLQQAPAILLQGDAEFERDLMQLAEASQKANLEVDQAHGQESGAAQSGSDREELAFMEACVLSRAADTAEVMQQLWQTLHAGGSETSWPAGLENPRRYRQLIYDRARLAEDAFSGGNGEAWLRCCHYLMFRGSPEDLPGQFKFAPNRIGLHQTTAPQHLVRTVRLLLDEIRPSLPAGPGRAAFMLVAITRIHPFVDGNGRLARFVFNGELEQVGASPVLFLPHLRKALTDCQDQALYRRDFSAFTQLLAQARQQTGELLQEFRTARSRDQAAG
jgi:cytochrome c-type biogenesis protein CcmH/NrfG